ncbi:MAG: hypothetical protein ACI8XO_002620 [Verrucomicrobiales bacterium]|jgi:hypothetical protein
MSEETTTPDSATENDPKHQQRDDPRYSPGAGCIIFIFMIVFFVGIITAFLYVGSLQDKDIVKFTDEEAVKLPDDSGTADEVTALRKKLDTFKETIRAKQPATLELSTRDLNLLVHNETSLIEIRDMIYFDEISPEFITGRTSMPLNRFPPWKPRRYLNGTITMKLEVSPGRLFLRLIDIKAAGKEVEPGFVERIAQDDLLDPYKTDENKDLYDSIQTASMNDGSITIQSRPIAGQSGQQ